MSVEGALAYDKQCAERRTRTRKIGAGATIALAALAATAAVVRTTDLFGAHTTAETPSSGLIEETKFGSNAAAYIKGDYGNRYKTFGVQEASPDPNGPDEEARAADVDATEDGENAKVEQVAVEPNTPHIVLFLLDDAGMNDWGYTSIDIKSATPYMDSLAAQGVKLTRYYTEHSCTPARAALLSGASPNVVGAQHEVIDTTDEWGLNPDETLIPGFLSPLGYKTHLVGKWDIGHYAPQFWPTQRGFDSYFGMLGCCFDKFKHTKNYITDTHSNMEKDYTAGTDADYYLTFGTYMWENEAKKVVHAHNVTDADAPLFLMVSFDAPHAQVIVPQDYLVTPDHDEGVLGAGYDMRLAFAANMRLVDNAIKGIVKQIDVRGMLDNTVIAVTSDNGAPNIDVSSDPNGGSNWPYRGSKGTCYEGGVRVPAFVYSPLITGGREVGALFHVSDWLPTFVEGIAGGDTSRGVVSGELTDGYGVNQWATITGEVGEDNKDSTQIRDEIGFRIDYLGGNMGAIIVGQYKFIHAQSCFGWWDPQTGEQVDYNPQTGEAFKGKCTEAHNETEFVRNRLYNIYEDPTEEVDLYGNAGESSLCVADSIFASQIVRRSSITRSQPDHSRTRYHFHTANPSHHPHVHRLSEYVEIQNQLTSRFCYWRNEVSKDSQYRPSNQDAMETAAANNDGYLTYWKASPNSTIWSPIADHTLQMCASNNVNTDGSAKYTETIHNMYPGDTNGDDDTTDWASPMTDMVGP